MQRAGVAAFLSLFLIALTASAANAQSVWQYQGVTFPMRAGWCAAPGTDAGGVSSFVAKPCDQQWPQLSTAPIFPAGSAEAQLGVVEVTSRLMVHANSPRERERVAAIGRQSGPECVMTSYNAQQDGFAGLRSVGVTAAYQCPHPVSYNNITFIVRARDGALWGLAADYGNLPISAADMAHVRAMIAAIGTQQ